jgi:hypothetical protein
MFHVKHPKCLAIPKLATHPSANSPGKSTANLKAQEGSQIKRTTGEHGCSACRRGSSGGVDQLHGSATRRRHLNPYASRVNYEVLPPIPPRLRFRAACNSTEISTKHFDCAFVGGAGGPFCPLR